MAVEFLGECHSDMCGANRMLSAFTSSMEGTGTDILLKTKTVGLKTNGENANMGKKGGLWALVAEYLGRTPITISCVAVTWHLNPLSLTYPNSVIG